MKEAVHIVVSGLVQGVGFRYYVYRQASALNLRGYTRNLMNGKVEVLAVGERGLLEEFIKMIKIGPRAAHVTDMRLEWVEADETYAGFEVY